MIFGDAAIDYKVAISGIRLINSDPSHRWPKLRGLPHQFAEATRVLLLATLFQ